MTPSSPAEMLVSAVLTYTVTKRDGLRCHDGQLVRSEDCVESLKRWGKEDRFGQLRLVLDALGKPSSHVPFMMPARIAVTSPPAAHKVRSFPLPARRRYPTRSRAR
jgi:peptide/nickel transport system substrate-binding protein